MRALTGPIIWASARKATVTCGDGTPTQTASRRYGNPAALDPRTAVPSRSHGRAARRGRNAGPDGAARPAAGGSGRGRGPVDGARLEGPLGLVRPGLAGLVPDREQRLEVVL